MLLLTGALALGGCSADITRFDLPSGGGSASGGSAQPRGPIGNVGAGSLVDQPAAQSLTGAGPPLAPSRSVRDAGPRAAAQPEPLPPPAAPMHADAPRPSPSMVTASVPPTSARGEAIEVQQGDTLFALSKRHKVSISELMALNDLQNPNLRPGQKLFLPSGKRAARPGPQKPLVRPEATPPAGPVAAAPSTAPSSTGDWSGTHTIKAGESLYGIARQHKVGVAELQSINGIPDPRKVRQGTVIKVPGPAPIETSAAGPAPQPLVVTGAAGAEPVPAPASPEKRQRVAAVAAPTTATDAEPAPKVTAAEPPAPARREAMAAPAPVLPSASKLRWPVRGKVIAGFGPRMGGLKNDGVNLAVPLGTDVHAAEAGIVSYAGSELTDYGNLILIQHENNLVTAYAHNDQLLVKYGETIRRGQVIAKAGKTGMIDQPQVHFELRHDKVPIDPVPYLEKM